LSSLVTHEECEINQVHKGLCTVVAPPVGAFCKSMKVAKRTHRLLVVFVSDECEINQVHKGLCTVVAPPVGAFCKSIKVEKRTNRLSSSLATHEECEVKQVHKGLRTVAGGVVTFEVGAFCKSI
jgi:hypothetical protein